MTAPVPDHASLPVEQLRVTAPSALKLTLFHNDMDWVVAESTDDATRVLAEAMGGQPSDFPTEWEPWGEERPLTMRFVDEDNEKLTLTGREWAARGRAYLGSRDY